MEPGWSQREEGREVRENEVVDRSAGSGGLKVRERQPDWGGDRSEDDHTSPSQSLLQWL